MSSTEFKPESSSPSLAGPSRKRPRSELSSEERKEARAHRNRIAAQNSRDRRKAQFTYLEQRLAELEDENKRLRAGLPPADPVQDAKDRENQELRARIATLERGLEAVVKAFAVQGLPSSVPATDVSSTVKSSEPVPSFSAETPTPALSPSSSVSTPSSTGSPTPESFPISPAPSHASLDFSFTSPVSLASLSTSTSDTGGDHASNSPSRVPAAGELELYSPYIHDIKANDTASDLPNQFIDPVDDATMETLFHEILCSHSRSPSPEPAEPLGASAGTSESVQAADLFQTTRQTQEDQETQTAAGSSSAQVSTSLLEGVKLEGTGEEGAETKLSSLGMDLDGLGMATGDEFGMGLDVEMLNGNLFEENATIVSPSGGFTATWLDDYTTSLLEGFVPPTQTALQPDSSATPRETTASSWESLEASLSVGVGVF
ncbi:hypothetical protein V5O48_000147 [Marasmius crinis-equi]|uniref:X-box-binding protein 1 n=1 Tax=Marasmius crinis-equi TaxID=585013 RepID=A0ABR3G2K6_9AGAR